MKGEVSKMRILREVCNMRLHTVMAFAGLLTTCLLISTACDWRGKVNLPVDVELPPETGLRGPFTAFLSADRSELIRGDVELDRLAPVFGDLDVRGKADVSLGPVLRLCALPPPTATGSTPAAAGSTS